MGQLEEAIGHWLNPAMARVRVLAPENAELPDFAGIMEKNWPPRKLSVKMDWQADMGNRETVDLDNGCQVVLIPDATVPYISLDLLMPGGNAMLKPDQQGLAELTARLLTDGSGDLDAQAMERWLSERAASMSASAGLQTFGIALTGPSRFESDYFDILRHVLLNPRLAPAELAREVNNMKAAISMRKDNPLSYMFSRITPFLFPDGQPYGYERLGDPDILDKLNVVDVRNFWTMQSGQPWILAIAGSFNREKALEFAKSLPKPRVDKFEWPVPHWGKEKDLRLTLPGRNQAHLMQIFNGNEALCVLAYNSGPGSVKKWLNSRANKDFDEFVENVPYLNVWTVIEGELDELIKLLMEYDQKLKLEKLAQELHFHIIKFCFDNLKRSFFVLQL